MSEIPWNRVKWGVARRKEEVCIKLVFPDEYSAMAFFDLFQEEEVELTLKGVRKLTEAEEL